tara:strand:- start:31348 stop:31926 length:579 start_codon:yes stop_codon:yes gene_type:complete
MSRWKIPRWLKTVGAGVAGAYYAPILIGGGLLGAVGGGIAGASLSGTKGGRKFWDTHIGREGLVGGIGDATGWWDSGTTVDKKGRVIKALDKDIANIRSNVETSKNVALQKFNTVNALEQKKTGGIINSMNFAGNTATDSSRFEQGKQAISTSVNKANMNYIDTISKNIERDAQASDRIFALEGRKQNVRSS